MDTNLTELELKVLYEISKIMGQALNLDQTMEAVLAILSDSLAMQRGTVTLKDPETGHLRICASHGLSPEEKQRGVYRLDEGVTGLIFRTAQPFVVPDVSKEPLFLNKTKSRNIDKGPDLLHRGAHYSAWLPHGGLERGPPLWGGRLF